MDARRTDLPIESATKERRRRRLVAAAVELLDAHGANGFSIDAVAARAEMSRRSVFNYFPSVDDLIVAAGTEMVWGYVESVRVDDDTEPQSDEPAAIFEELATTLRSFDMVRAMVRLTDALSDAVHPGLRQTTQLAVIRATEQLASELHRRHPSANDLEIDLLVSTVVAGVVALSEHWSVQTGLVDDAESRALWDELLQLLLASIRDGYLNTAHAIRTH